MMTFPRLKEPIMRISEGLSNRNDYFFFSKATIFRKKEMATVATCVVTHEITTIGSVSR